MFDWKKLDVGGGVVKLDFSKLFAKSQYYDEEKLNKEVKLNFIEANRKLYNSGRFDIPEIKPLKLRDFKKSEIKDYNNGTWVHPNDPSLDEMNKPVVQNQSPLLPLVQHNPIASVQQSELYRQQQRQMYQIGQQYLANRGPVQYQFNNPNGLMNLRRFQDDMNKQLNDPSTIIQSIMPRQEQQQSGFVRVNEVSEEEFKDSHYDREKQERLQYAEKLKKNKDFGNPNRDINSDEIPKRRLPYQEVMKRIRNTNTPTAVDTFKTKSGDSLIRISTDTPFSSNEQQSAYARAQTQYNEQKKAILSRSPIVYNNGSTSPRFYNPNDYTNYISNTYPTRPRYYSGYGYVGVSGLPDENGLPTVWYNDNGKYLIPTQDDINNQSIPIIHTNKDGKEYVPKVVKEESSQWYIRTSRIVVLEDGTKVREYYNSKDGSVRRTAYNKDSDDYEDYSGMGKDSIEQMNEDDTAKIATELSRYNVELADIFAWARNCIDYKEFLYLKRDCLDQLIEYRDADPFCLIKSTVVMVKDTILVLKPKPTTLEEIDSLYNTIESNEHSSMKLDNIYKKYLFNLDAANTLNEKLEVLWNARDIEVIPRSKDKAYAKAKQIIDNIKDPKVKKNFDRYRFTKSVSRSNYLEEKKGAIFEKEFASWWNKPREGISKNQYENLYSERMNILTINKLYNLKMPPEVNPEVAMRARAFNEEWLRLSEGRFNKPNMTFKDFIVAMNVTEWNIGVEESMRHQFDKWKNTKTDTTECKQSIIDKVLDRNIERLGLSQVTKLPRYAPVSLSGIDKTQDTETRRQKFIERLLARQGRPMI